MTRTIRFPQLCTSGFQGLLSLSCCIHVAEVLQFLGDHLGPKSGKGQGEGGLAEGLVEAKDAGQHDERNRSAHLCHSVGT